MRKFLKRFPFKKVFVYLFILLYTFFPSLHAVGITLETNILDNTEVDESKDILNEGISDPEWIAKPLHTYEDGIYTVDLVQKRQYTYPDNEDVRVMFTSVTEEGNLTINKVALSEKEKIELNTTDDYAWEITSTMSNGSFEYNLTLPNTLASTDVEVIYTEDGEVYESIDNVEVNEGVIYIEGLDHFTVFVLTEKLPLETKEEKDEKREGEKCQVWIKEIGKSQCFETIQEAINYAKPGFTIYVSPGKYTDFIVNKALTIAKVSEKKDPPIIYCETSKTGVLVEATNVIIDGLEITNCENGVVTSGDFSDLGNLVIKNTSVNENKSNGLFLLNNDYKTITLENVNIHNNGKNAVYISGNRIEKFHVKNSTFENNEKAFFFEKKIYIKGALVEFSNFKKNKDVDFCVGKDVKLEEFILRDNNFFGSGSNIVVHNESQHTIKADSNWWDSIAGPEGKYKGEVKYQEWLCEPYETDWVSENGMCNLNNAPVQRGYNVNDGTENVLPPRYKCEREYTNINGVSIHWVDVANGNPNVLYQRQYSKNGTSWQGSEIYSRPYTDYKSFGYGEVTHFSRVRAFYDINGNKQYDSGEPVSDWSNTCGITYDKTPPEVTLLSPEDNFYTNQGSFHQHWTSEDTDISTYQYRSCSNNPISDESCDVIYLAPPQTSTSRTVNNNNITFWWQVRATDYAGNIGTWSNPRKATMDSIAPTAKITSHTEKQVIRGTQTISGQVEDQNLSHYWFVIHDLNGVQVQGQNTVYHNGPKVEPSFEWNTNNVTDGEYTIKLEARDLANNKGEDSIHWVGVIVDNTPPTISEITIKKGGEIAEYIKEGDEITISAIVSDEGSDIKAVSADFSFNEAYNNRPTPQSVSMAKTSKDTYAVTYTVPSGWNQKEIYITVAARDLLDNYTGSRNLKQKLIVDNKPPAKIEGLTIFRGHNSSPENELGCGSYTNNAYIRIQWNLGPEDDISDYWLGSKSNTTYVKISSPTNYYNENLSPGDNLYYTIIAEDKAGNLSDISEKCSIILDTEAPISTITSLSDGFITNQQMKIEGTTTDDHSVLQVALSYTRYNTETELCEKEWIEIERIENTEVKLPFNWSRDAWSPEDGIYCIKAQGTDLAGNIENTSIIKNIIYDTEKPEISLVNLINGVLGEITADGGLSGLESIKVKVGYGEWEDYKEGMNLNDMANRTPGTYTVYIKVTDKAGNESETQRTFIIPAPFSDTLGEVLGAFTEPFTPQPVQAQTKTSATTQLLAQSTQEEELPEKEEVEVETEVQEETEDIQPKEVKSEDEEEEEEKKGGIKWWVYILILLPLLFFFFILYKRRKEEEEKQL